MDGIHVAGLSWLPACPVGQWAPTPAWALLLPPHNAQVVIPLPQTSKLATTIVRQQKVVADLIHIDASHGERLPGVGWGLG